MKQSRRWAATPQTGRWLAALPPVLLLAACGTPPQRGGGEAQLKPQHPTPLAAKAHPVLPAAGSGRGGYYLDDGPGDNIPPDLDTIADAEPRVEPFAKGPSRPYSVFGKAYIPITDTTTPFRQRGVGSWYGKKFHNQKTASGELYDMYKMTAAHPTLPVPSYARVTNLKNGAQVIVRINDRGPFHSNRIIDLSYTAALKLGYLGSGSGELEVERLLPDEIERIAAARRSDPNRLASASTAGVSGSSSSGASANAQAAPAAATRMRTVSASTGSATAGYAVSSAPAAMSTAGVAVSTAPVAASAPVTVETLPPPASPSAATQASPSASAPVPAVVAGGPARPGANGALSSGFYLQFGAYTQEGNAQAARATLMQSLSGLIEDLSAVASNGLYRLYAGPYADRAAAHEVAVLVRERSGVAAFVFDNR